MSKRTQTTWNPPSGVRPQLMLYNSLTRKKEVFVPHKGNQVSWYSCGPTVYDASHMGHARSYISFDILRRVLSEYFRYDVTYVMNITDIDDKIIKRARQNYLFQEFMQKEYSVSDILTFLDKVMAVLSDSKAGFPENSDKLFVIDNMLITIKKSLQCIKEMGDTISSNLEEMKNQLLENKDAISEYLDKQYGSAVEDNSIFTKLPKYWENEYHTDMDLLNVKRPDVLTRVSEYIPEIIEYIQQIIKLGYGYESNCSVYFDVDAFDSKPNHFYAKLVPEAYGDTTSLQEGEGDLTFIEKGEKKSSNDFALWKASKPGEPWWASPWGNGRPGWHIECSAMASRILGGTLDIHTGGVDLKFPHHDNEIAQAEAYYDSHQWVNYFLHSGHLTIAGCKMSKSLKNFITIKDALKKHTARQLRLAFLLHSWKDTLDYSDNTMEMAVSYEKMLNEFFLTVKDLLMQYKDSCNSAEFQKLQSMDLDLLNRFNTMKEKVHEAICDNIDTRKVLEEFRDFVNCCNIYIRDCGTKTPNILLLVIIARSVTNYFQIFGVIPETESIGFPLSHSSLAMESVEEVLMPYLRILADFRYSVRLEALKTKQQEILDLCDQLRDDVLITVGVRLEDREGKPSAVKLVDKETLMKEKEEKERIEREKIEEKNRKLEEQAKKEALKKIPPEQLFRLEMDKYSQFDEKGIPTHDAEGKEVSKGLYKKLQKLQIQHAKKHQEYLQSVAQT